MILNQELLFFFCKFNNEFLSFSNSVIQQNGSLLEQRMWRYGLLLRACRGNGNAASEMYHEKYPNRRHPSSKVKWDMFSRLKELGCFYTTASEQHLRSTEDEERILERIQENLCMSVREIAWETGIPTTTVWRILNSNGSIRPI